MNGEALLVLTIAAGTPLLLAVLGELMLQRSGIINIGLEGLLLSGAMSGVLVARLSGSATLGLLGGAAGAALLSLLFGWMAIARRADQIVAGAAINFVAAGLTSLAYSRNADLFISAIPALPNFALTARFSVDMTMVFAWVLAPLLVFTFLWRTRFGLVTRACGENPEAVKLTGRSVARHRWTALLLEAFLCGIGGAYIALGLSSGFAENMVAGRGFIALAIVIFGRWRPVGALAGTLLFSVSVAAQYRLQAASTGVQFHLLLALPYVLTLIVLVAFMRDVRAPQWLGKE